MVLRNQNFAQVYCGCDKMKDMPDIYQFYNFSNDKIIPIAISPFHKIMQKSKFPIIAFFFFFQNASLSFFLACKNCSINVDT